jgi:hypothetical protein
MRVYLAGPHDNKQTKHQISEAIMADDFVLNSLLSVFLDDYHEIPSDFDASSLSAKDVDVHVNRTCFRYFELTSEIVDAIAESSESITKEDVFDTLKGFLK